jgi:hypothetical protein
MLRKVGRDAQDSVFPMQKHHDSRLLDAAALQQQAPLLGLRTTLNEVIPEPVWEELNRRGFAFYEVDVASDLDDPIPSEKEIIAFGITYGEYWEMYPQERPKLRTARWEPRLLLGFREPPVQLVVDGITGESVDSSIRVPLTEGNSWSFAAWLTVDPESSSVVRVSRATRQGNDWILGDHLTLQQSLSPPGSLKYWEWAWNRTGGPVYFILHVASTQSLEEWFDRLSLRLWHGSLASYQCPGLETTRRVAANYQELLPGVYHYQGEPDWTRDLYLEPGRIQLVHGFSQKPGQLAAEASLLSAVLAGELGEVVCWKLVDGDYNVCQKGGRDAESLRRYLDPRLDEKQLREESTRCCATVKLSHAASYDEAILVEIGEQLGATGPVLDWLAQCAPQYLPCSVYLQFTHRLEDELLMALLNRLSLARQDIYWRVGY